MRSHVVFCSRYDHFKDILVCKAKCPHAKKCGVYRKYVGVEGAEIVDSRVDTLLSSHPARYCKRYSLEVATVMKGEMYLAVPADNQPSVMDRDEIVRRAEKGERFLKIYRISHEMELKYQLVPKKEEEADSSVDKPKGRAQKKQKEAAPEQ